MNKRQFLKGAKNVVFTIAGLSMTQVLSACFKEEAPKNKQGRFRPQGKKTSAPKANPIKNTFPLGKQWKTPDPFLFCAYHLDRFPAGNDQFGPDPSLLQGRKMGSDFSNKDGFSMYHGEVVPGFPGHPHRGFETISILEQGFMDHADSMGASARFGAGDVQWMTAGKGIVHSEMFPLLHKEKPNTVEIFQIWLNLPKKDKMIDSYFTMLWNDQIPLVTVTDKNKRTSTVKVIAGDFLDENAQRKSGPKPPPNSWASKASSHVHVYTIVINDAAELVLPETPDGCARTLYFYAGEGLNVSGTNVAPKHGVTLSPGAEVKLVAKGRCKILVLGGKPIGEPVAKRGSFVMNTKEEIRQAYADYRRTKFGTWPWKEKGPVHGKLLGRFAKHSDGREETRKM